MVRIEIDGIHQVFISYEDDETTEVILKDIKGSYIQLCIKSDDLVTIMDAIDLEWNGRTFDELEFENIELKNKLKALGGI